MDMNHNHQELLLLTYFSFYMLVMYVAPLTVLVGLNIAIGLTIHRARLHRHSIVANGYASSNEFTRTSQDFSRTASSYNEGPAMIINGSQSRRTRYQKALLKLLSKSYLSSSHLACSHSYFEVWTVRVSKAEREQKC